MFVAYKSKDKLNSTTRFLLVLCRGTDWSTILQEECRMKVLENRAIRKPFGPKRYEVNRRMVGGTQREDLWIFFIVSLCILIH